MYLVDHPAAIQTPPNFYDYYNLSVTRKNSKNKREQYLEPEKSKLFLFYLMFHVFFKFKQPNNSQNKF
jgi:hypothetical protein